MQRAHLSKRVSTVDYFCIGFGSIVGVGWAVSINNWMVSCGGPVPAAVGYLLVLVLMLPIGYCYAELVHMLPVAGGGMSFAFKAFDEKIALISGWASLGGMIAILPWEAIQITDMLRFLVPNLSSGPTLYTVMGYDIRLNVVVIGMLFSLLLFAVNMRGLATAALVQRILCFALVSAGLLGAVAALAGGRVENLLPIYDTSNTALYGEGLKLVPHTTLLGGCFAIVIQAAYFLAGFETIPQGIEEAGGESRSVGRTVILSVTLACLFYSFLVFSFGIGYPWQEFAKMDRPATASMLLQLYPGSIGKVLYWIITVGAIAGLLTTWNGFFTASANLLMSMGRGRLIPMLFSRQNMRGVAVYGQYICLVLSVFGPFLGANMLDTITCFSAIAFILSWLITCWSFVILKRRERHSNRRTKGLLIGYFAALVSSAVFVLSFIPSTPFYSGRDAARILVCWIVIGLVLYLISSTQRKGLSASELQNGVFESLFR